MSVRSTQLALLVVLACREPPVGPPRLLDESFEQLCDDAPCGWTQSEGPPGAVRMIETIHPGEHGLRIEAGAAAAGPAGEPRRVLIRSASLQIAASARCDRGAQLVVEAAIADTTSPAADTFSGRTTPPEEWSDTVEVITITASRALVDGGLGGNPLGGGATLDIELLGLTVRTVGEGTCDLDHLVVDGVGVATNLTPIGC